jgi:TnpA family transposase
MDVILAVVCAMTALARFGSAARGDPIHGAGVQLGSLLRTAFLTDYFRNAGFRRELRRVLILSAIDRHRL